MCSYTEKPSDTNFLILMNQGHWYLSVFTQLLLYPGIWCWVLIIWYCLLNLFNSLYCTQNLGNFEPRGWVFSSVSPQSFGMTDILHSLEWWMMVASLSVCLQSRSIFILYPFLTPRSDTIILNSGTQFYVLIPFHTYPSFTRHLILNFTSIKV